ncbi:MAG TPA: mismatch-specific DNA-glycosylase [Acidimicrobiia bacterium]|nr:mismatch-specific DNA-glycosylase [Acidimicrobiia bacterium]
MARAPSPFSLPLMLVRRYRATVVGETTVLRVTRSWDPEHLAAVVLGGGFSCDAVEAGDDSWRVQATRQRTLPDTVGPGLRALLVGLNPSLYSADAGVGFARPGNRFWPAALAAGLVTRDRDPLDALCAHGVGMTDLVKRATARADELSDDEFRAGAARVRALVEWLTPASVCFVGLSGYRIAVDRRAVAGWQRERFGGAATYVMPNPSGLNAHAPPAVLAEHLRVFGLGLH